MLPDSIPESAIARPTADGGIKISVQEMYDVVPEFSYISFVEIRSNGDVYLTKYCSDSIERNDLSIFSGCNAPQIVGDPCIDNELVGTIDKYQVGNIRESITVDILTGWFRGNIPDLWLSVSSLFHYIGMDSWNNRVSWQSPIKL